MYGARIYLILCPGTDLGYQSRVPPRFVIGGGGGGGFMCVHRECNAFLDPPPPPHTHTQTPHLLDVPLALTTSVNDSWGAVNRRSYWCYSRICTFRANGITARELWQLPLAFADS